MKVYLRADENEAGVTVEDDRLVENGVNATVQMNEWQSSTLRMTDSEARAVVEGLLRRMWSRGEALNHSWFDAAYNRWHADKAKR